MSIIGQQTTTTTRPAHPTSRPTVDAAENPYALLAVFLPLALIAAALAKKIGVFRRCSIDGPPRVAARESLATLLALVGTIVFFAEIGKAALGGLIEKTPQATTSPATTPSPTTTAVTGPTTLPTVTEFTLPGLTFILAPPLIAMALGVLGHATTRPGGPRLLGLSLSQLPRGVRWGLIGSAIMIPVVYLAAQLTEILWNALNLRHPTSHDLLYKMRDAPGAAVRIALITAAVLVAPLFEEFIFRGHLQTLLTYLPSHVRRRLTPADSPDAAIAAAAPASAAARWGSVVVTSLCFAAVHVQPGAFPYWMMPPIFVLSLCVGYAYERTGNLWTTITMHAAFNAVSTILYFAVAPFN
jgi:membrane protease YdiL (CAAX protease family)